MVELCSSTLFSLRLIALLPVETQSLSSILELSPYDGVVLVAPVAVVAAVAVAVAVGVVVAAAAAGEWLRLWLRPGELVCSSI